MRLRASTKIAVGAVLFGCLAIFGYRVVADRMLGNTNFPPLTPGKVNLVGIELGKTLAIRVENQIAQLVEAKQGAFESNEGGAEGPTEGANAKRVPIKDLLRALQGDELALGHLIMVMNERGEDESWPPIRNVWQATDIEKALQGDAAMQAKLERDLNMKLDGTPLDKLRLASYENGIIVESGVPVDITVDGVPKHLIGRIQTPYKPLIMQVVERRLKEKSEITNEMIAGYYGEEASKLLSGEAPKENVRQNLIALSDPTMLAPLAEKPAQILSSAKVIVTDAYIQSANYVQSVDGKNPLYDLTIGLSDEGRRRLWAYSRGRTGAQLLLISNGVAIAAPRIRHELATSDLTITQMHDKSLLDDMIETLHASGTKK